MRRVWPQGPQWDDADAGGSGQYRFLEGESKQSQICSVTAHNAYLPQQLEDERKPFLSSLHLGNEYIFFQMCLTPSPKE